MFQDWCARWFCPCIFCLILLVSGCSYAGQATVEITSTTTDSICRATDVAGSFPKIETGASRAEVTACLGKPAEVREYDLPTGSFFGPSEGLASTLKPGTPVEEWLYYADDQTYYLWFASAVDETKQNWRLVDKAIYPTGADFDAE